MADAEPSSDSAGESARRLARSIDDFVTYSEIEKKLGQVVKPGAAPKPTPSTPSWRWGIVVAVIGFGALRAVFNAGGHSSQPPSYSPPQPRPIQFGIHEVKKGVEEDRPALPPLGDEGTDEELQRKLDALQRNGGDPREIQRLEHELLLRKAVRGVVRDQNVKATEKEGPLGPPKP
jgi:hypothetical protein